MPFSGALPLAPPTFLEKSWTKNFSVGCGATNTKKIETRGVDETSAGFFLAIKFTSVGHESVCTVTKTPRLKVLCQAFFQESGKAPNPKLTFNF